MYEQENPTTLHIKVTQKGYFPCEGGGNQIDLFNSIPLEITNENVSGLVNALQKALQEKGIKIDSLDMTKLKQVGEALTTNTKALSEASEVLKNIYSKYGSDEISNYLISQELLNKTNINKFL